MWRQLSGWLLVAAAMGVVLGCGGPAAEAPRPGKQRDIVLADDPVRPKEMPRIFTLAVGVSKHEKPSLSLDYADRDAEAIDAFYASAAGGAVPPERRKLLRNQEATRRGILKGLQDLASLTQESDLLVVFLALHGVPDSGDRLYFLAHDSDPNDLVGTGLPESELEGLLRAGEPAGDRQVDLLVRERLAQLERLLHPLLRELRAGRGPAHRRARVRGGVTVADEDHLSHSSTLR